MMLSTAELVGELKSDSKSNFSKNLEGHDVARCDSNNSNHNCDSLGVQPANERLKIEYETALTDPRRI